MMNGYLTIVLLLAILSRLSTGNQQHLVCKTIQDVFDGSGIAQSSSRNRRLQGPPGKVGPQGIQGRPGPAGPPASVDYERINDVITAKVASALEDIEPRIARLERNVSTIFTERDVHKCSEVHGGLYNGGKCYTIPRISNSENMDRNAAIAECAKTGALLAEIQDRTQQALYDFALTKKTQRGIVNLHIGMEFQRRTSTLLLRSGQQVPANQLHWINNYPKGNSLSKYLLIEMGTSGIEESVGMWNTAGTGPRNGVICEKNV